MYTAYIALRGGVEHYSVKSISHLFINYDTVPDWPIYVVISGNPLKVKNDLCGETGCEVT